ncbi:MAG: DUF362 domain-containing protein [bacterium]|nr:DUF362 domain-containing protein [bacterium]
MLVSVAKSSTSYPKQAVFDPDTAYPEYPGSAISEQPNGVYRAVRDALALLGYDGAHFGQRDWNPLGQLITPGQTVFIKPNMVDDRHRFDQDLFSVVTHPSVLRAVADYVAIALKGRGKIVIGDNPHVDADFDKLREHCSLDALARNLRDTHGLEVEVVDLRFWHMPDLRYYGFKEGRRALSGDPKGETEIDLGRSSLLEGVPVWLLRGTYQNRLETIRHHFFGRHRYVFSNSILDADVFISIPKLKAHAKVGATLNIKGLIGTIANKNCLVHWRIGYPLLGGDEYPPPSRKIDYLKLYLQHLLSDLLPSRLYFRLRNFLNATALGRWYNRTISVEAQDRRMLRGAWESNDTIWRMTVDVYNAFVNDVARVRAKRGKQTRFFSVVDGIVGGDTDGPHFPHPVDSHVIVAGEDLLAVDLVAARLMDYRVSAIPYLNYLSQQEGLKLEDISIASDEFDIEVLRDPKREVLGFRPPYRWPSLSAQAKEPGPSFLP